MSRIVLSKHPDGSDHVVVGWDHPAGGTFWQEWATKDEVRQAEAEVEKAEEAGSEAPLEVETLAETGVKRERGMWPGLPLDDLRPSMPQELQPLVTSAIIAVLYEQAEDPASGRIKLDLSDKVKEGR